VESLATFQEIVIKEEGGRGMTEGRRRGALSAKRLDILQESVLHKNSNLRIGVLVRLLSMYGVDKALKGREYLLWE
jgi:hypothetical protein